MSSFEERTSVLDMSASQYERVNSSSIFAKPSQSVTSMASDKGNDLKISKRNYLMPSDRALGGRSLTSRKSIPTPQLQLTNKISQPQAYQQVTSRIQTQQQPSYKQRYLQSSQSTATSKNSSIKSSAKNSVNSSIIRQKLGNQSSRGVTSMLSSLLTQKS